MISPRGIAAIASAGLLMQAGYAAAPPGEPPPEPGGAGQFLEEIARQVDSASLRATIERLVAFGTRHTASETSSPSRGIGAARRWVEARFGEISKSCDSCLRIVTPAQAFTGKRFSAPTQVVDVVAVQTGSTDPDRVVLITAHLDSRITDVMDAVRDAPGANDDGSGVAAVLEAARILSRHRFGATIVYGVLSGEEQGLFGGRILADYARAQGWRVTGDLNNDIVGNTDGGDGIHDNTVVRVFSEGTRATETPEEARKRHYEGGELDSPSRNLSRYLVQLAEQHLVNFRVEQLYRTDRFGRGGDQVEFLEHGFPAVRLTEAHENYARQHQDVRTEAGVRYGDTIDGVDFAYLAQVTRLNAIALACLARAPAPPSQVRISGAVSPDTSLSWQVVPGAASYRVHWRHTSAAQWQYQRTPADPSATAIVLPGISVDNWFFGVSSVSADGFESPVVFPGAAGAFPN